MCSSRLCTPRVACENARVMKFRSGCLADLLGDRRKLATQLVLDLLGQVAFGPALLLTAVANLIVLHDKKLLLLDSGLARRCRAAQSPRLAAQEAPFASIIPRDD